MEDTSEVLHAAEVALDAAKDAVAAAEAHVGGAAPVKLSEEVSAELKLGPTDIGGV